MKRRALLLGMLWLSLLSTVSLAGTTEDGWYPFVIPAATDENAPAHIGKLILDAPAGKHGFLKAQDSDFVFADGTPARFWGTNLCFGANFPTKKQARILADRLAFFGFNAVRLHHMDFHFEPKGIFADTAPAFKDPQAKTSGHLSQRQLDRLDYLIAELKQRGIYVDINLLVARRFTEADGLPEARAFGIAAKPMSMFDDRLVTLQQHYAQDLLTHLNPYTGLRYSDDPAVALVEITNENSLLEAWRNNKLNASFLGVRQDAMPPYYTRQLDERWNTWLKKKYSTVENVKAAWGLNPQDPAQAQNTEDLLPAAWGLEQHHGAAVTTTVSQNKTILTVDKTTEVPWHAQYRVNGVALRKGRNYLFTFTASADRPLTLQAIAQRGAAPWDNLGLSAPSRITTTPQTFRLPFTAAADCDQSKIGFIIGFTPGTITLEGGKLTELTSAPETADEARLSSFQFARPAHAVLALYSPTEQTDIRQFYIDLEKNYVETMRAFLTSTCGVKAPVTGIGGFAHTNSVAAQTGMDFIDKHAYWDHPGFPRQGWDSDDFTIHGRSLLQDKDLGFINSLIATGTAVQTGGQPFTVTEWNHCYPNRYAYETPVLMAAEASQHGWDGLFEFAFSHGWKVNPEFNSITGYFDILANPQKLILSSIGAYLYISGDAADIRVADGVFYLTSPRIRGASGQIRKRPLALGPVTVTSQKDGDLFLYAADGKPLTESARLVLTALGEVANSASGWHHGRFAWGHAPTRLQALHPRLQFTNPDMWKIYELTPEGQRGKELSPDQIPDIQTPWIILEKN